MTRAAFSGHGYEFAKAPTVVTSSSTPSVAKAQKERSTDGGRSSATSSTAAPPGLAAPKVSFGSAAWASSVLNPGAKARTAKAIAKAPPPMPPAERWADAPDGLRQALEALTESEKNWDLPPGTDPVYWVQVGSRLYHRNDSMRQAIELENRPPREMPRLDLSLILSATENGTPCYVAVPAAGEDVGSGTFSSTLPTMTTDFSTPDSTLAQDGSLSGKGYAKGAKTLLQAFLEGQDKWQGMHCRHWLKRMRRR